MSEDDRNLSKDALDLNEYYSYHEHTYKDKDKINDEKILRNREDKEFEKRKELFDKDKKFYYGQNIQKFDDNLVHRDAERDFEKEKGKRKTSSEIARETFSGNI